MDCGGLSTSFTEHGDATQNLGRNRRLIRELKEVTADVRPTESEDDLLATLGKRRMPSIVIRLQDACEVSEMGIGPVLVRPRPGSSTGGGKNRSGEIGL